MEITCGQKMMIDRYRGNAKPECLTLAGNKKKNNHLPSYIIKL